MGKRVLQLYAEDIDIELARAKGINLSAFFREIIKVELYQEEIAKLSDKEKLITMKIKLAKIAEELAVKTKELEQVKKQVPKVKTYKRLVLEQEDAS